MSCVWLSDKAIITSSNSVGGREGEGLWSLPFSASGMDSILPSYALRNLQAALRAAEFRILSGVKERRGFCPALPLPFQGEPAEFASSIGANSKELTA